MALVLDTIGTGPGDALTPVQQFQEAAIHVGRSEYELTDTRYEADDDAGGGVGVAVAAKVVAGGVQPVFAVEVGKGLVEGETCQTEGRGLVAGGF